MSLLSDRFDHLHAVSVFIVDFFGLGELVFSFENSTGRTFVLIRY